MTWQSDKGIRQIQAPQTSSYPFLPVYEVEDEWTSPKWNKTRQWRSGGTRGQMREWFCRSTTRKLELEWRWSKIRVRTLREVRLGRWRIHHLIGSTWSIPPGEPQVPHLQAISRQQRPSSSTDKVVTLTFRAEQIIKRHTQHIHSRTQRFPDPMPSMQNMWNLPPIRKVLHVR